MSRSITLTLVGALLIGTLVSTARAEDAVESRFKEFDVSPTDERVTRPEFTAKAEDRTKASQEFTRLDANGDNEISLDEYKAGQTDWLHTLTLTVIVLSVVVLPFVVGSFLANMIQMPDYAWRVGVILFAITVGLVLVIGGWPPALGPDLRGGVILVYEIDEGKRINDFRPKVIKQIGQAIDVNANQDLEVSEGTGSLIEVRVPQARRSEIVGTIAGITFEYGVQLGKVDDKRDGDSIVLVYEMKLDDFRPRIMADIEEKIGVKSDDSLTVGSSGENIIEVRVPKDRKKEIADLIEPMNFSAMGAQLKSADSEASGENVVLRYEVENAERVGTMDELIPQLSRRLNRGGVKEVSVRKRGSEQVEIILPGADGPAIDDYEKMIKSAGSLEFRIVPTRSIDPTGLAGRAMKTKGNTVYRGDVPEARWVKKSEGVDVGDKIIRTNAKDEVEVLVLLDKKFNIVGQDLASAAASFDSGGRPAVNFGMKPGSSSEFGEFTEKNKGKLLGIVLDDELMSAATIQSRISDRGEITGSFTQERVDFVVSILKAGELSATLNDQPISREVIGPQLGEATIKTGSYAMLVSMAVILVFMVVYYRFAGVVACMALTLNVLLVLAIMIMVGYEFTLAGLAGLVLTVGMAVDANVLIFERIREEVTRGAALRMAIRNGFGKATTTIVDANLTTLITAIVLFWIGTEQVKGFAVTLILGISMSMFTAIFCSRVVFDIAEKKRFITKLGMLRLFGKTSFDFISKRFVAAAVSTVLIIIGLVATYQRGKGLLDIDFTGGSAVTIYFNEKEPLSVAEVRKIAEEALEDTQVSRVQIAGQPENLRYKINTSNRNLKQVQARLLDAFGERLRTINMNFEDLALVSTKDGESTSPTGPDVGGPSITPPTPDPGKTIPGDPSKDGDDKEDKPKTDADPEKKENDVNKEDETKNDETKNDETKNDETKNDEAKKDEAKKDDEAEKEDDTKKEDEAKKDAAKDAESKKDVSAEPKNTDGASTRSIRGLPLALGRANMLSFLQADNGPADDEEADEKADESGDDTPTDTPDPTTDDKEPETPEPKPAAGDTKPTPDDTKPTPGDTKPDDSVGTGEPETPSQPGSDGSLLDFSPPPVRANVRSEASLTFSETISHPSLLAVAEHARAVLEKQHREMFAKGQIDPTFANPSYSPGSNVGYKTWTFEVDLPPEKAQLLLNEMKDELAVSPIFPSTSNIGGRVSGEMKTKAISALLVSLLFIVAYIWIRFQNVVFGLAAVVALVHDVLITLGCIAVSAYLAEPLGFLMVEPFKISLPIVAAFLTIIGYSLNDTIVVFDRIREVRGKSPDLTADMLNTSINQTLNRTLLTSITTLIVVTILYFFGGPGIHAFAFALVVGVVAGTYSSVFVASPALLAMMERRKAAAVKSGGRRTAASAT